MSKNSEFIKRCCEEYTGDCLEDLECGRDFNKALSLLSAAEKEQACRECKGLKFETNYGADFDKPDATIPCSACDGKGTLEAYLRKQIEELQKFKDGKTVVNVIAVMEDAEKKIQVKDKQIADQQTFIEQLAKDIDRIQCSGKLEDLDALLAVIKAQKEKE